MHRSSHLDERFASVDVGHEVADLADAPFSDGDGLRGARVLATAAHGGPCRSLLLLLLLIGDLVIDATAAAIVSLKVDAMKHLRLSSISRP